MRDAGLDRPIAQLDLAELKHMGKQAKLKQERKKKYYLDKIQNSSIGKFVNSELLSHALDIRSLRNLFDLMENFNQDLCFSDEASS